MYPVIEVQQLPVNLLQIKKSSRQVFLPPGVLGFTSPLFVILSRCGARWASPDELAQSFLRAWQHRLNRIENSFESCFD